VWRVARFGFGRRETSLEAILDFFSASSAFPARPLRFKVLRSFFPQHFGNVGNKAMNVRNTTARKGTAHA
jgi:hypothetical protein